MLARVPRPNAGIIRAIRVRAADRKFLRIASNISEVTKRLGLLITSLRCDRTDTKKGLLTQDLSTTILGSVIIAVLLKLDYDEPVHDGDHWGNHCGGDRSRNGIRS